MERAGKEIFTNLISVAAQIHHGNYVNEAILLPVPFILSSSMCEAGTASISKPRPHLGNQQVV